MNFYDIPLILCRILLAIQWLCLSHGNCVLPFVRPMATDKFNLTAREKKKNTYKNNHIRKITIIKMPMILNQNTNWNYIFHLIAFDLVSVHGYILIGNEQRYLQIEDYNRSYRNNSIVTKVLIFFFSVKKLNRRFCAWESERKFVEFEKCSLIIGRRPRKWCSFIGENYSTYTNIFRYFSRPMKYHLAPKNTISTFFISYLICLCKV